MFDGLKKFLKILGPGIITGASEERAAQLIGKDGRPRINWAFIHNMRIDNLFGMFFSQVVSWAIIVVTGTALHGNGVTTINTASDAARALQPLRLDFLS